MTFVRCPSCGCKFYTSTAVKYDKMIECPRCFKCEMQTDLQKYAVVVE